MLFEADYAKNYASIMYQCQVVMVTTHYTVFVLLRLLICLTKHAFGLALLLPGQNQALAREANRGRI